MMKTERRFAIGARFNPIHLMWSFLCLLFLNTISIAQESEEDIGERCSEIITLIKNSGSLPFDESEDAETICRRFYPERARDYCQGKTPEFLMAQRRALLLFDLEREALALGCRMD
jgi:hypothetical protein